MKSFFKNDLLPEGFKVLLPTEAHKEETISSAKNWSNSNNETASPDPVLPK